MAQKVRFGDLDAMQPGGSAPLCSQGSQTPELDETLFMCCTGSARHG
jgi:hypothetical protein